MLNFGEEFAPPSSFFNKKSSVKFPLTERTNILKYFHQAFSSTQERLKATLTNV